jgi:hypothetical protein
MGFTPVTSKLKKRKIAVYDLEWIPETSKLTLAGFYDGETYKAYKSMAGLLNRMLSRENRGTYIYAHAGGLFDMLWVLEELMKNDHYLVEASFSGSSAVVVRIRRGHDTWVLIDSYWLLRDKLDHLARTCGMAKTRGSYVCSNYPACGHVGRVCEGAPKCGCGTEPESLCMFYAPREALLPYNMQDCKILYTAITMFQDSILEMGTDLQLTIASTAMRFFRRKYLKSEIVTSTALSDAVRPAYIASRVEPYREFGEDLNLYDINSSFPYAMTFPTPGALLAKTDRIPSKGLYVATCTVEVPEMFLPPLGRRAKRDGRIYFPTGRWEGMFSRPDLELLEECGGKIDRVGEVLLFESRTDFADYATDLYEKRRATKDEFEKMLYKLFMNSCYGKTAESRDKTMMVIHPKTLGCPHDGKHEHIGERGELLAECVEELFPGVVLISEEKEIAHEHVPIAMQVTAEARRTLYRYAQSCKEDLYYSDTDSLYTHQTFPDSSALGGLKFEKNVKKAHFLAPKLYKTDGKVKSKGFSRMTEAQYDGLQLGEAVPIERLLRIREMARSQSRLAPHLEKLEKRLQLGKTRPKRNMRGNGEASAPWDVRETEEKWRGAEMR